MNYATPVYQQAGPFTVETFNPFLGPCRCWLTSDPSKRVLCEGSPRAIAEYFEAVCAEYTRHRSEITRAAFPTDLGRTKP